LQKSILSLVSMADCVSITNAIFGFLAIVSLISEIIPEEYRLRASFSFILLGLLADGLDGIVARKFKRSEIGEHLDSMADITTMGIATSIFIYVTYQDYIADNFYRQIYILISLILFLSFGIIRLASYYIMKNKNYFTGLPAPASSIILLLLAFLKIDFIFILPAVVIIGAMMVSGIKFPKPGPRMDLVAAILIIFSILLYDNYYRIAPLLLFIAIIVYAIGGPVYTKFLAKRR